MFYTKVFLNDEKLRFLCLINKVSKRLYQNDVKQYLSDFYPTYSQKNCELFWSDIWHRSQLFANKKEYMFSKDAFRILLPPPNITGSLHLGHSLTVAIQDALCRFYRMNGKKVFWFSGTDHAGIATQIIIEKILWSKHGKTRNEISEEEYSKFFDQWKSQKVSEIHSQLKSLGVSIDFQNDYFTLSPEMSELVNEAFIMLFNRGLIYRASHMVNWSYYLKSTLSDIEIEHKLIHSPTWYEVPGCSEKFLLGVMHHFKYPVEGCNGEFVKIATTRIESLMGDVALCVNPNDSRYSHLIGKAARNPFTNELMPILAEETVKPDFGTGVLKLTPAHSAIDYEIASRHQLPLKNIFDDRGFIKCDYEKFNNMHRYAAKEAVQVELERFGLYCGHESHRHWLPTCSRSGDIIESKIVPQWFLKCESARDLAEFVVNRDNLSEASSKKWEHLKTTLDENNRSLTLIPSSYRNTWKDWFSRYKNWCISRQIFWGHRIPAYQVWCNSKPTDVWIAAKNKDAALEIALTKHGFDKNKIDLQQDRDVLDTWFSSSLLPLVVTGWFENHENFKNVSPLSLMETGHDIIFFWVARMALLSLLLANRLPFDKVLLHGMICDETGKKMSKSKANVVDPMHVINGAKLDDLVEQNQSYLTSGLISEEKFTEVLRRLIKTLNKGIPVCGADTLRLSLLQTRFKEQKVNFDLLKPIRKRAFSNKMHQTLRFMFLNLNQEFRESLPNQNELTYMDKWILSKLAQLIRNCRLSFHTYDLHHAARQIESFWTNDLCDVYLESIKSNFSIEQSEKSDLQNIRQKHSLNMFIYITRQALKLIHPFMPFITENLYQFLEFNLSKNQSDFQYRSILETDYPDIENDLFLKQFDQQFYVENIEKLMPIIKKIRWFRQNFRIHKEPLVKKIRIATMFYDIPQYKQILENLLRLDDSRLVEFVHLDEIYKYCDYDDHDCYCIKVDIETTTNETNEEKIREDSSSNSFEQNEVYVLFTVDKKALSERWKRNLNLKSETIGLLEKELSSIHATRFTENYKKLTKIVS